MGIKIMMPPEVMEGVAGELIAKQVLREIVRSAVKTPFDGHYFAVMVHKGVSTDLHGLTFGDISKVLCAPRSTVHGYIAEHMIYGSARGGCKLCEAASDDLKKLIVEEKRRRPGTRDPLSVFITMASVSSRRR